MTPQSRAIKPIAERWNGESRDCTKPSKLLLKLAIIPSMVRTVQCCKIHCSCDRTHNICSFFSFCLSFVYVFEVVTEWVTVSSSASLTKFSRFRWNRQQTTYALMSFQVWIQGFAMIEQSLNFKSRLQRLSTSSLYSVLTILFKKKWSAYSQIKNEKRRDEYNWGEDSQSYEDHSLFFVFD